MTTFMGHTRKAINIPQIKVFQSVWGCVRCSSMLPHSNLYISQHKLSRLDTRLYQVRWYSQPNPKKNFLSEFINNMKQDFAKDKAMKENLKKFRSDYEKLEQSDALKKAREKFESIESGRNLGANKFKKSLSTFQDKIKETAEEIEKTEYAQKAKKVAEDVSKTAGKTAETLYKQSETISKTKVFQSVSEGVKAVKTEFDETTLPRGRLYKAPEKLKTREEISVIKQDEKEIEADTETTGVQLHKDSRWYQSWQNFKDNNQFVHKLFDMKTKYDESDNVLVRATRTVTDKLTELFGGVFTKTEMSEVLTEVTKMDPTFSQERFIQDCKEIYIPNILEAIVRGELEILEDWCYEAAYNTIAHPIKQAKMAGYSIESRVLDINHVDSVAGKMMDQGPVIVITFQAQQIMCVRDSKGSVVEGDPEKIMRMFYVWAFCRDQSVLDPRAAWRLIDLSASPAEQFI